MELFQPNNLSRARPEFVPVDDPKLNSEVGDILAQCYSLSGVEDLKVSRAVGANVNTQNLQLNLGGNRYFLKCRSAANRNSLLNEAAWAVNLRQLGIKVPSVILTAARESVARLDDWFCVLYRFEEGEYFSGRDNEVHEAGNAFASLTNAALQLMNTREVLPGNGSFFEELPELLKEISATSIETGRFCRLHQKTILANLNEVIDHRSAIEIQVWPMHLDFHPLNLLMKDSKVVCILDFEHLKAFPVAAGLGFAGYKLIRQAMVDPKVREQEFSRPNLFWQWLEGWNATFSSNTFTPREVMVGARYRVLYLIWFILTSRLKKHDDRFNYDLEKQILSLYEIAALNQAEHGSQISRRRC